MWGSLLPCRLRVHRSKFEVGFVGTNPTVLEARVLQSNYLTTIPSLFSLTHREKHKKREKEKEMVVAKRSYEDSRRKRVEENNKRMEALNLPLLSQALKTSSSPKPSPVSLSFSLVCNFHVFLFHTHLVFLMPTFT